MKLWSDSFKNGARIPEEFAFGKFSPKTHLELSSNKNPHLGWSELPGGTKSLVLICHDPDVPSRPDAVNQEGKIVPASLPRISFYHWVLIDLLPSLSGLEVGEFSGGMTPRGKPGPQGPKGTRQGLNDYTKWFEIDPNMNGKYFGYDGPCPPWNDEILHHYHFTLYALDVEKCSVEGVFTGPDVVKVIQNHTLEQTSIVGIYSINPKAC